MIRKACYLKNSRPFIRVFVVFFKKDNMVCGMWYRLNQLKLNSARFSANIDSLLPQIVAKELNMDSASLHSLHILSRSLDARHGIPTILYNLMFELDCEPNQPLRNLEPLSEEQRQKLISVDPELPDAACSFQNPIVVGTGPCGIFAALALAMTGCKPIIIDRGFDIAKRNADCQNFLQSRNLNPESNLLIGEGGAGTYSDGKLYTGTKSSRSAFILKTYTEAGAPNDIQYMKHPHIGSDNLGNVAASLRKKIMALGGTFLFGTAVKDLLIQNKRCTGVITAAGEKLSAPAVLIAAGLGGRELNAALRAKKVEYQLKGFQIGSRIEHPQTFIDQQQYHMGKKPDSLSAAEYHLLSRGQAGALPVCSFCMCPGGEVVMASGWEKHLVSNGMSCHARAGKFANSALIVTLSPTKFGSAEEAFSMLEGLEQRAFKLGGEDYTFPAQDVAAFLRGEKLLQNKQSTATTGLTAARLDQLFPRDWHDNIVSAVCYFDRQCPGFICNGKFIGVETCVSSPVRFLREPQTLASSLPGLWLGGEGAGCAGGIMSAAIDGMKLACAIIEKNK